MKCVICGRTAIWRVKQRGYCREHKAAAVTDWSTERGNWYHQRTHERVPRDWRPPWASDRKHRAHEAAMHAAKIGT